MLYYAMLYYTMVYCILYCTARWSTPNSLNKKPVTLFQPPPVVCRYYQDLKCPSQIEPLDFLLGDFIVWITGCNSRGAGICLWYSLLLLLLLLLLLCLLLLYMHAYMHTYIHVHICIYIYIHVCGRAPGLLMSLCMSLWHQRQRWNLATVLVFWA